MGTPRRRGRVEEAAYLAMEETSEQRHEWYDGEVFAMAGGSDRHNLLCVNLVVAMRTRLGTGRCVPFGSDRRHKVATVPSYSYPDMAVRCRDVEGVPSVPVIVEVLSESTEAFDRGGQFERYRQDPALQEYVLVHQRARRVEHFRRVDVGRWELTLYGPDDRLALPHLGIQLPIPEIYEGAAPEVSDDEDDPYRLD